ncbi:MAG: tetratricopeptide repeat protein [Burkholderiales bacterium]|nr:tetratricopeptide repeat protein [Burkholderiales bacterium]
MPAVPASLQPLVLDELARLCASDSLRRTQALVRLLRYLVERHVAGDAQALRETSIALEVFRRDPGTYDPQSDPIVRVSTGRLRERIGSHYERRDGAMVRIVLPKGGYVPEYVVSADSVAPRRGIAVLRTRNATGDATLDTFCAALADRLCDHLARAGIARVIARASVDGAVARSDGPAALADLLDVAWILDSAVALEDGDARGDALRIAVRMLDAADASVRWSEARIAGGESRHAAADRLIDAVVVRVAETLPGTGAPAQATSRGDELPPAQRAALDAARLLLLQRTLPATEEAIALAERAAAACPGSAQAWGVLASALYSRMTFQDQRIAPLAGRVRAAAEHALALDPDEPVALRSKAIIVGRYEWRVAEASALFERALRAMPHYTSARLNRADLLIARGEFERALAEVNLALVYDPLSSSVRLARALALAMLQRYDEARAEWSILRASGERSYWVYTGPARMEALAGRLDVARALSDEALRSFPDLPDPLLTAAYVAASAGDGDTALRVDGDLASRFPHFSPTHRALVRGVLRDRAGVLQRLDDAIDARDIAFLHAGVAPEFAWLAKDPEFARRVATAGCSPQRPATAATLRRAAD